MKKLLGIVLALALVLTTVSAMAMVDIPLDNGGLATATKIPVVTVMQTGNKVTFSGDFGALSYGGVTILDSNGYWVGNKDMNKEDDGTMSVELEEGQQIGWAEIDNDNYNVSMEQSNGELKLSRFYDLSAYMEFNANGKQSSLYVRNEKGGISADYGKNGKLSRTYVHEQDDEKGTYINVSYDGYGRFSWASAGFYDDNGKWVNVSWDDKKGCWINDRDDTVVTSDKLPTNLADYGAPAAREFVTTIPTKYLADLDISDGTVEENKWNTCYYDDTIYIYFEDGELSSYTVRTFDDVNVSFDKYGRLAGAYYYDQTAQKDYSWSKGSWEYYDQDKKEWVKVDSPVDLDPATVAPVYGSFNPVAPLVTLTETGVTVPTVTVPAVSVSEDGVVSVTTASAEDSAGIRFYTIDQNGDRVYKRYVEMTFDEETKAWTAKDLDAYMAENKLDGYVIWASQGDGSVSFKADGTVVSAWFSANTGDDASIYIDAEKGTITIQQYDDAEKPYSVVYNADGSLKEYYIETADCNNAGFDAQGNLIYFWTYKDGQQYEYTAEDGWTTYDRETGKYVPCDAPEGIDLDSYEPLLEKEEEEPKIEYTWYAHNTVCVAGLCLRDEYPGLTSKWYNFVPVDLTQDGVYNYTLVASNLFYIGNATVVVDNGTVTVGYSMARGEVYPEEECLQWFTSVDQMTGDYLEAPTGEFKFGEPVSIADDLGGADVGLLFICNRVTYRQPYDYEGGMLVRYWKNLDQWKAFRQDLYGLLDKIEK